MTEFSDLLSAARRLACPYCSGKLTVRHNGHHLALSCFNHPEHAINGPDDCPGRTTLDILRREAEDTTRTQRIAGRWVAQDMADLGF